MITQNNIPTLALIVESAVAVGMMILSGFTLKKFLSKKRNATLALSLTFSFYALGVLATAIFKFVQFYSRIDYTIKPWSELGIILAYCFSAMSNIFMYSFIERVYLEKNDLRIAIFSLLNGLTIGFMIPFAKAEPGTYVESIPALIWHVINSLIIMGMLIFYSFREVKRNKAQLPRIGFILIGMYGILIALVFPSFALDIIIGDLRDTAYTPFYYIAWILAGLSILSGYLGYIMPKWFRDILTK